jgi:hypothetical protein
MKQKNNLKIKITFSLIIILLINFTFLTTTAYNNINNEKFDFLIISPDYLSNTIIPLKIHKEKYGIKTIIVTTDEIKDSSYFPVNGRDNQEQIKYFIKNAIEYWTINYVMLVGAKDQIPARYIPIWDSQPPFPSECFSDLYYADIYDENNNFCSWDSDNNNIFSEPYDEGLIDKVDLYPDVAIGRLLCTNEQELQVVIEKIIKYEINTYNKSWFKNIILCGGDDAMIGDLEDEFMRDYFNRTANTTFEGEYIGDKISEIMNDFNSKKIYASGLFRDDAKFLTVNNINKAINDGAGFLIFYGHGNTFRAIKTNYPFYKRIWLPFPSGYLTFHTKGMRNNEKLPIAIFSGCYCGDFTKTDNPIVWEFIKNSKGGSIASFACSTGSVSIYSTLVTDTYIGLHFINTFKSYKDGITITGDIWKKVISLYLDDEEAWSLGEDFSWIGWGNKVVNHMVIQEWTLFGDPTLKIGGYL